MYKTRSNDFDKKRYTKVTLFIKIIAMTIFPINKLTMQKLSARSHYLSGNSFLFTIKLIALISFMPLFWGLPLSGHSQTRDVPANTIIGSSGKKAKVVNRAAPKSHKNNIKVYKHSAGGTTTFSDRPPKGQAYEVLSYKCFACDVHSKIDWHSIRLYPKKYAEPIEHAAAKYGVDAGLVRAIVHAESAFRPTIQSHKGAVGLMQLMPATAAELGVTNRQDPIQNINGGVKYLAQLLTQFKGDTQLATAAYNAGPGAVRRYGGVPPFAETQAYIKRVAILAKRYKNSANTEY